MAEQTIATPYDAQIRALEERLATLRAERAAYINQKQEEEAEKDAYQTAYEAIIAKYAALYNASNDGLKDVIPQDALAIPSLPFPVKSNWFYSITTNDGIKDVVTEYVAIQDGIVTEDNIESLLTLRYLPEDGE